MAPTITGLEEGPELRGVPHAIRAPGHALQGCPCGRPCEAADQMSPLMSGGEGFRFKRGDVLWEAEDPAADLLSVCVGFVRLAVLRGERYATLEIVGRNGLVGEAAAVAGARHAARCEALTDGRGVRLAAPKLRALLARRPGLREPLLQVACSRTSRFAERLGEMGDGRVRSRLAGALVDLGEKVGLDDARGVFIPVRLSRGDLADLAGCRVETAIRVLSSWQREGLVDTSREGLILHNLDGLRAIKDV